MNNLFYKCRGIDFRSPLSVMNGVPNSPPTRYVQVTDAVIANNSFYNCSPISFCEGSDTERSLPPDHVFFLNNIFYVIKDSRIYQAYDNITGFQFAGNKVSQGVKQLLAPGFIKTGISFLQQGPVVLPRSSNGVPVIVNDSLNTESVIRLNRKLPATTGFSGTDLVKTIQLNAHSDCGAAWFNKKRSSPDPKARVVNCDNATTIYAELEKRQFPLILHLIGQEYNFDKPLTINGHVRFISGGRPIKINTDGHIPAFFEIKGNGHLSLQNLKIDGSGIKATHFISSSDEAVVEHYSLLIESCRISGLSGEKGCRNIFYAYKSSYADSLSIKKTEFSNCSTNGFIMNVENDNKGLYSAEKIIITNDIFELKNGILMDIYRGGTDESTMGPFLVFDHNRIHIESMEGKPWIQLTGVQKTYITNNDFINTDPTRVLIVYKDLVRAHHWLTGNKMPGKVETDPFVISRDNKEK